MKIKQFLRRLTAATEEGYRFSLESAVNLGPAGERRPKWVLRCRKIPGEQLRWGVLPVEAVCHYTGHGLPDYGVAWIVACEQLGMNLDDGGMILRAGEQIVCFNRETGELRVKYSVRLRQDMLKACGLKERCKAKTLFG